MAVYEHPSSKTHIQITSSSPSGSSDTWMIAGRGGSRILVVPLSLFHTLQLIEPINSAFTVRSIHSF